MKVYHKKEIIYRQVVDTPHNLNLSKEMANAKHESNSVLLETLNI
jgi:hypothetical protein